MSPSYLSHVLGLLIPKSHRAASHIWKGDYHPPHVRTIKDYHGVLLTMEILTTARRSAACKLPTFQPPPSSSLPKDLAYPLCTASQRISTAASGVLTASGAVPDDILGPMASRVNRSSLSSSAGAPLYQQQMGHLSTPGNSCTFNSRQSTNPPYARQNYLARPQYAPSSSFHHQITNSPTTGKGLPPPSPCGLNLPFSTSMPIEGTTPEAILPNMSGQAHQQQHYQPSHGLFPDPPHAPPQHAPDGRSPAQRPTVPTYPQLYPTAQSPNPNSGPQNRKPEVQGQGSMAGPRVYPWEPRPFYHDYSMPVLSSQFQPTVRDPGAQPHYMIVSMCEPHPGPQNPQDVRPFKCDQCYQGFHRNHDLKRHKRIHLAVKPFPCSHCEKSFSRKDALKARALSHHKCIPSKVANTC